MGFWDTVGDYSNRLMPLANQLSSYAQEQQMNDVFAANPEFATKLYGAKNQQQENALRKYAIDNQIRTGKQLPSNVQEYQYYQSLPPEKQAEFLNVKRSTQMANLGDQVIFRAPDGSIASSYAVGINPNNQPELQGRQAAAQQDARNRSDLNFKPVTAGKVEEATRSVQVGTAGPLAAATAAGTAEGKGRGAAVESITTTAPVLASFDDLAVSAQSAPSGKINNAAAEVANNFPQIATEGMKKAAQNQGDFSVKRSAVENQIRAAFRVAGSGGQTDADALPIINMLPNANDDESVKATKIRAAKQSLITQANAKALSRGLAPPFAIDGSQNPTAAVPAMPATEAEFNQPAPAMPPQATLPVETTQAPPQGAVQIGTYQGKRIYRLPDGRGWSE